MILRQLVLALALMSAGCGDVQVDISCSSTDGGVPADFVLVNTSSNPVVVSAGFSIRQVGGVGPESTKRLNLMTQQPLQPHESQGVEGQACIFAGDSVSPVVSISTEIGSASAEGPWIVVQPTMRRILCTALIGDVEPYIECNWTLREMGGHLPL